LPLVRLLVRSEFSPIYIKACSGVNSSNSNHVRFLPRALAGDFSMVKLLIYRRSSSNMVATNVFNVNHFSSVPVGPNGKHRTNGAEFSSHISNYFKFGTSLFNPVPNQYQISNLVLPSQIWYWSAKFGTGESYLVLVSQIWYWRVIHLVPVRSTPTAESPLNGWCRDRWSYIKLPAQNL
jgi:hypothetical protein